MTPEEGKEDSYKNMQSIIGHVKPKQQWLVTTSPKQTLLFLALTVPIVLLNCVINNNDNNNTIIILATLQTRMGLLVCCPNRPLQQLSLAINQAIKHVLCN